MRKLHYLAFALGLGGSVSPALAGEVPLTGPLPSWVVPAPEIAPKALPRGADAIPIFDEQMLIEGDTTVTYVDMAQAASSAEVLNRLGTLGLSWQPAHGDLTVHRMEILRGDERIDLMAKGPGLTVLRREVGLERLIMDGQLTAVRQIEGLRIGDVLRVAFSVTQKDPLLAGKAQNALVLFPKPVRMAFGRARLVWPESQQIAWKALAPGVSATPRPIGGGRKELVIDLPVAKWPELPADIPVRFRPQAVVTATNFANWDEVSKVMAPLYRIEGTITEGSELAALTDRIAAAHAAPVERLAEALRVVQNDVRYQLIALGSGNYQPQTPSETWKMRYGDCKAKTMLLLAMLHRLGISAEPVLANTQLGDLVPDMLPAPLAFDHVLVRAEVAGESFWLDGTGLGARLADIRDVPRFGHVLPVRAGGASPMALPRRADARASTEVEITYDNSASAHLPVPFTLKLRYTGAQAEQQRQSAESDSEESLLKIAERAAKTWIGSTTIVRPTASYDPANAIWTLNVEGVNYFGWEYRDGRLELELQPNVKVDFEPDRSRSAWQNLPALLRNPWSARARMTLLLPEQGKPAQLEGTEPVRLKLPLVDYDRTVSQAGTSVTLESVSRENGVEVAPAEISATRKAIGDAMDRKLRIAMPASYPYRWDDVDAARRSPAFKRLRALYDRRIAEDPDDAERLSDRAWLATRVFDWATAEGDYSKALAIDPSAARYVQRARTRATTGNRAGALADAREAFELDSGNDDVRWILASELAEADKLDEALELLDPDPDVASEEGEAALLGRAELLSRGGRSGDAIEAIDAALAKRSSSAALLNGRCWFKALNNLDLDGALADCSRAIELASDPAAYFDSRAMVHFRAGRMKEALTDLNAALAIAPEIAASRFVRGLILTRTGDAKAGAADTAAARKLSPSIDAFFGRYGIKP